MYPPGLPSPLVEKGKGIHPFFRTPSSVQYHNYSFTTCKGRDSITNADDSLKISPLLHVCNQFSPHVRHARGPVRQSVHTNLTSVASTPQCKPPTIPTAVEEIEPRQTDFAQYVHAIAPLPSRCLPPPWPGCYAIVDRAEPSRHHRWGCRPGPSGLAPGHEAKAARVSRQHQSPINASSISVGPQANLTSAGSSRQSQRGGHPSCSGGRQRLFHRQGS